MPICKWFIESDIIIYEKSKIKTYFLIKQASILTSLPPSLVEWILCLLSIDSVDYVAEYTITHIYSLVIIL